MDSFFFLFVHLLLAMLASDMTSLLLDKVLNEREQVSRIWTVNGIGSEGKALLRKYNPAHTPTDRSIDMASPVEKQIIISHPPIFG